MLQHHMGIASSWRQEDKMEVKVGSISMDKREALDDLRRIRMEDSRCIGVRAMGGLSNTRKLKIK